MTTSASTPSPTPSQAPTLYQERSMQTRTDLKVSELEGLLSNGPSIMILKSKFNGNNPLEKIPLFGFEPISYDDLVQRRQRDSRVKLAVFHSTQEAVKYLVKETDYFLEFVVLNPPGSTDFYVYRYYNRIAAEATAAQTMARYYESLWF